MSRLKALLIILTLVCFARCKESTDSLHGDPDNGGLFLPDGFEALVVADSTGPARHLAVNENGDIYVKMRFSRGKGAKGNVALRDTTHDGKADMIERFGDYEDRGGYGTSMRIHRGYLYFSSARVVYRNKLTPGKLIPESEMETILTDDHPHAIHWHMTKPVAFDDQGNMFVPFGAPSNACQDLTLTPAGKPGFPGLNPCPELEKHGGIWRFDAGKTGTICFYYTPTFMRPGKAQFFHRRSS
jgi:glucose/arabinose dehydrogenase